MRKSRSREIILEELKKLKTHPRGDELYDIVRRRLPRISLGTVYRNLNLMQRQGSVLEIFCGDFNRYDGNIRPHYHFHCRKCQRLWDFEVGLDPGSSETVENAAGFRIDGQYTIYYGQCDECLSK